MSRRKKRNRFKTVLASGSRLFFQFLFILWILTVIQVLLLKFVNPPFTVRMAWSRLQKNTEHHGGPRYHWRPLREISPHLKRAVLASEDQRFLSHYGFDFVEMKHAMGALITKGKTRGASTITMQVARTVYLWPGRSWVRKLLEAYYTVLIEVFWTKDRILEVYLNTVDWGSGVIGAEAASRRYFHIHASGITPSQAALLAAILPSPHKWSPTNPNRIVMERQQRILRDMKRMPLL